MPRFVILHHDYPVSHWDLLLERPPHEPGTLRSWRLEFVSLASGVRGHSEPIPDHRPVYLEYEGEISAGRGSVQRLDAGTYHPLEWTDERVTIRLSGEKLVDVVLKLGRDMNQLSPSWTFQIDQETART